MIKLAIKSTTPIASLVKDIQDTFENNWLDFQSQMSDIAYSTLDYMKFFITSHQKRSGSSGKLVNSIQITATGGFGEAYCAWGIGEIAVMDEQAKYWRMINWGGMTSPTMVPGSFGGNAPDKSKAGYVGTERFDYDHGAGNFMMFPKWPILPMNYIENTELFLQQQINMVLSTFK